MVRVLLDAWYYGKQTVRAVEMCLNLLGKFVVYDVHMKMIICRLVVNEYFKVISCVAIGSLNELRWFVVDVFEQNKAGPVQVSQRFYVSPTCKDVQIEIFWQVYVLGVIVDLDDKSIQGIRVFKHQPVNLWFLFQNIIYPL